MLDNRKKTYYLYKFLLTSFFFFSAVGLVVALALYTSKEKKEETTTQASEQMLIENDNSVIYNNKFKTPTGKTLDMATIYVDDKKINYALRKIDNITVEKDFVVYEIDEEKNKVLNRQVKWRDINEGSIKKVTVPQEVAENTAKTISQMNNIKHSELLLISPNSDVFQFKKDPRNPAWVIMLEDNNNLALVAIDAVTGEYLGNGVAPPNYLSVAGPMGPGSSYRYYAMDAERWFLSMGIHGSYQEQPTQEIYQAFISDPNINVYYHLAHGSYDSALIKGDDWTHPDFIVYASNIHDWMLNKNKMNFTFIGSCAGLCQNGPGTFSYEFRKGEMTNTAVVGYCNMSEPNCLPCWYEAIPWQDTLFEEMKNGDLVFQAYIDAQTAFPQCNNCIYFDGDRNYALVVATQVPTVIPSPTTTIITSPTNTPAPSIIISPTLTITPTQALTPSPTLFITLTPTVIQTRTPTPSRTNTPQPSLTLTTTRTPSPSSSRTPSPSPILSKTKTPTPSRSPSPSKTTTPTPTINPTSGPCSRFDLNLDYGVIDINDFLILARDYKPNVLNCASPADFFPDCHVNITDFQFFANAYHSYYYSVPPHQCLQ